MTDFPPQRDDERFQEVLGRLDALVRRGRPEDEPPPPPPAVSEATIPVLTDIYQPSGHSEQGKTATVAVPPSQSIEAAVSEMLPEMVKSLMDELERQVKPVLSQVLDEVMAEMRPQIEERIRQRLLQALTKD